MASHRHGARRRFPNRDEHAADLIQEFLDERGWSPTQLAQATALVALEHGKPDLTVSNKTIYRIVGDSSYGYVPHARCKAAIALVMGVPPWMIWGRGAMPLAFQRSQLTLAGAR